jgi:hypothetical protein
MNAATHHSGHQTPERAMPKPAVPTAPIDVGVGKEEHQAPSAAKAQSETGGASHEQSAPTAAELWKQLFHTLHELVQRGKTMLNLKSQVRHHPLAVVLGGSAVLLAIGSGLTLKMVERHRRRSLAYRVKHGIKTVQDSLGI